MFWTWFRISSSVGSQIRILSVCIYWVTIFLCELRKIAISYHINVSTLWSLGCIPVKTVCSMSTIMPCVNQQTFPATICQHPFCTLFRKPFTNSKWKSSWWLPVPHACYLDSSNGPVWLYSWLLNSTLHFCCVQKSPQRIMPMATVNVLCILQ